MIIPEDFVKLPRKPPFPEYDLAIGDTVWWRGMEEWGSWWINSMHYILNDGRRAASVIPTTEFQITDRERYSAIAPLDELKVHRGRAVDGPARMTGRPRKSHLSVKWDESRKRFRVIIPASWAGKQSRKWFESESAAHLWIAQRELDRASNKPLSLHEGHGSGRSIAGLVALFLSERAGKAGRKAIANHLDKLVAQFGGSSLDELHTYAVKEWLRRLDCSKRTRWGIYASCRSLGRWAVRYQFAERNPFDAVEPPDKGAAPKTILTVAQMRKLLELPKVDYMQAWIVLGGFAGLRTEEIHRLTWEALDFDAGEIHVGEEAIKKTKGMRERYVAMLPALLRWIPRGHKGPIIKRRRSTFHWHAVRLAKKLGYGQWPHNCLRHSFASYHLAMWEDAGKTAHQLGHTSTQMVFTNYARAVKKADAEKWWTISRA